VVLATLVCSEKHIHVEVIQAHEPYEENKAEAVVGLDCDLYAGSDGRAFMLVSLGQGNGCAYFAL